MKPLRAHDFVPRELELEPASRRRGRPTRPAIAHAIAQAVRRRIESDKEAIRQSGIRLKDPARPTARELQRARITVARRQKFAGLFFQRTPLAQDGPAEPAGAPSTTRRPAQTFQSRYRAQSEATTQQHPVFDQDEPPETEPGTYREALSRPEREISFSRQVLKIMQHAPKFPQGTPEMREEHKPEHQNNGVYRDQNEQNHFRVHCALPVFAHKERPDEVEEDD